MGAGKLSSLYGQLKTEVGAEISLRPLPAFITAVDGPFNAVDCAADAAGGRHCC